MFPRYVLDVREFMARDMLLRPARSGLADQCLSEMFLLGFFF